MERCISTHVEVRITSDSGDVDAIKNLVVESGDRFASGDLEGFMALFTDDVVWLPSSGAPITGNAACLAWSRDHFPGSDQSGSTASAEEVGVSGHLAFARMVVNFTIKRPGEAESSRSRIKGMLLLRRDAEGPWRFSHYIWNDYPLE